MCASGEARDGAKWRSRDYGWSRLIRGCAMLLGRSGWRFWNSQFDPALLLVKGLIGDDCEPKLVGIKIERAILIGDRNTDEFDLLDHDAPNLM